MTKPAVSETPGPVAARLGRAATQEIWAAEAPAARQRGEPASVALAVLPLAALDSVAKGAQALELRGLGAVVRPQEPAPAAAA
jgi:hypothetical protein